MITLKRTDSLDPQFKQLVQQLNQELDERYGLIQQFYAPLNQVGLLPTVVLALEHNKPVGCGCFKENRHLGKGMVEIKRMFVLKTHRGKGIAKDMLKELELWASAKGYTTAILETGSKQPEAIGLYQRLGYQRIDSFEPYVGMPDSLCYRKELTVHVQ